MNKFIRNFSVIAHIDHGKSTFADRLLEKTGAISPREMEEQVLDSMELERERGITIKAHTVTLKYRARDGNDYVFNLIDTPGHVDFTYEVSRSLAACEGALLIIDATQGVEAQTLANTYLAIENDLVLIPLINKIDLQNADIPRTLEQMEHVIGINQSEAYLISAKEGTGIDEVIEAIVEKIPPPKGSEENPLKALVFDSWFDPYRGVIVLVRIFDGTLKIKRKIRFFNTGALYEVEEVGKLTPKPVKFEFLSAGEVGYLIANIKKISDVRIGDTITDDSNPASAPLPGFKEAKPMVFAGLFPAADTNYEELKDALEKLKLNDSSFVYEPENSPALGYGFRCGFLGLLHQEIVQERLEREFGLNLITTSPSVRYKVAKRDGKFFDVENPSKLPPASNILRIEEPIIEILILTPEDYLGAILKLLENRRGVQKKLDYVSANKILLVYDIPLNEIVLDFYGKLKSVSSGYASLDYTFSRYQEGDLVRLDILLNGEPIDALSSIVHKEKAYERGRALITKMRELIPRQLFEVVIQAAIGGRIIARESVKPMRKNVLAKCYGGDVTRKKKLLEKQKAGKKRMKKIGRIEVPQEAFLALLKLD
ncbi:MAG: translation elongation factor 4 [Acidobacteriota bacterium]